MTFFILHLNTKTHIKNIFRCDNINFARRTSCNRCGIDRPVGVKRIKHGGSLIGKNGAEKSNGLFSADDWMCKTYEMSYIFIIKI